MIPRPADPPEDRFDQRPGRHGRRRSRGTARGRRSTRHSWCRGRKRALSDLIGSHRPVRAIHRLVAGGRRPLSNTQLKVEEQGKTMYRSEAFVPPRRDDVWRALDGGFLRDRIEHASGLGTRSDGLTFALGQHPRSPTAAPAWSLIKAIFGRISGSPGRSQCGVFHVAILVPDLWPEIRIAEVALRQVPKRVATLDDVIGSALGNALGEIVLRPMRADRSRAHGEAGGVRRAFGRCKLGLRRPDTRDSATTPHRLLKPFGLNAILLDAPAVRQAIESQ